MTTATAPTAAPLTAIDRCDRCGAQAYLRVQLKSGGELLFCAHHAREHSEKLREIAEHVHDETGKLGDTNTLQHGRELSHRQTHRTDVPEAPVS